MMKKRNQPQKRNKFNLAGNWDERILIGLVTISSSIMLGVGGWLMFSSIKEWLDAAYSPTPLQSFMLGFMILLFFYAFFKVILVKKIENWIKSRF